MNYYFAPLHGITDYIYRNIVWKHFPYWDKLYAPFIQPNERPAIVPKEYEDICPENNSEIPTIPQVLTCDADGFIRVGKILEDCGYKEINLNLGCPARVVVSKGKGAGMLRDFEALDRFFDTIFKHDWNSRITVKTRLGFTEDDDFEELLKVYSRYPIAELIVHPRFRSDFYNGMPRLSEFHKVCSIADYPHSDFKRTFEQTLQDITDIFPFKICYNGDINSKENALTITEKFPFIDSIMSGRGALANPGLARELQGGEPITLEEFKAFHDDILSAYSTIMAREENVVNKMMQMWRYWGQYFTVDRALFASLIRSASIREYHTALERVYDDLQV